ncbi:MAG TPA: hypothetical protein VK619_13600, partial [Pyrinomonadaceae bacterium]|nr:hypothetical protein [Pyrinomonadaceae bacterium]
MSKMPAPPAGQFRPAGLQGRPGMPAGRMSARPYLGRALILLGAQKSLTAICMLLSLLVTLAPFVVSVAFSAIFQILGPLAGRPAGLTGASSPAMPD